MTQPFMRAYTKRLVETCHRRGAHAIGGMAAFIPSRRDAEVNATAMAKVREDKERESGDGFDGTWVAHPDLVPLATEIFDGVLGERPNQKRPGPPGLRRQRGAASRLHDRRRRPSPRLACGPTSASPSSTSTPGWPGTAPPRSTTSWKTPRPPRSARSQLWQWRTTATRIDDGRSVTGGLYTAIRDETLAALGGPEGGNGHLPEAAELLDSLVLDDQFAEFLTLRAYSLLD